MAYGPYHVEHECGLKMDINVKCPQCGQNFCNEDSQQAIGGLLAGLFNVDGKISIIQSGKRTTTSVATNYTATTSDDFILADSTAAILTVTLPYAVGNLGKVYTIMKSNAGTKKVVIKAKISEKINDNNAVDITDQFGSRTLISNGSNWVIYCKTP